MLKDFENTNTTELLKELNRLISIKEEYNTLFTTELLKLTNKKLTKKQLFLQKVQNKSIERIIKSLNRFINTINKEITKREHIIYNTTL